MKIGIKLTIAGFSSVMALAGSTLVGTRTVGAHPLQTERKQTMSNNVATLLKRNLYDIFGQNDPVRRRAAIDEIYTEDIVFYDPFNNVYRGRDEIERVAETLRKQHPDFQYQPIHEPEVVGNAGRIQWLEGSPGKTPEVGGTDFIVSRDGRIAAIYLFFDKRP